MPLVSVIMPAYNAERYIGEAIQSVLDQTLADWELIIVDDGSTDHTAEVVRRFANPRIRYIYQKNAGPSVARNRGLEHAQGTFIAFLDADDLYLPRKLQGQVAFLQQRPEVGLVAGGYHYLDSEGKILATYTPWTTFPVLDLNTWLMTCPVWTLQILVRREWLQMVGGFDPALVSQEDYDLLLRLALAGCPMAWLEQIVCGYRLHGDNRHLKLFRSAQTYRKIFERFFARPDLPPEVRVRKDEVLKRCEQEVALWAYAAGDAEQGAAHLSAFLAGQEWSSSAAQSLAVTLANQICVPALASSPLALLDFLWDHLPPEATPLRPFRRFARASAAKRLFFEARLRQDRGTMFSMLWQVFKNEPRLLDRGMFIVLARSCLSIPTRK